MGKGRKKSVNRIKKPSNSKKITKIASSKHGKKLFRSKSMEFVIKEGNEYLSNLERTKNLRRAKKVDKKLIVLKPTFPTTIKRKLTTTRLKNKKVTFENKKDKERKKIIKINPKKIVPKASKVEKKKTSKRVIPIKKVTGTDKKGSTKIVEKSKEKAIEKKNTLVSSASMKSDKKELSRNASLKRQGTDTSIGKPGGPIAGMIDIVFCVDTTGSMGSYLEKTKSTITSIINKVKDNTKGEDVSIKFGFVSYKDHPPQDTQYVTKFLELTKEKEIRDFINNLTASGGGDSPEAVMDGLYDAAKLTKWRSSTKIPSLSYIIHVADAPPHGDIYGSGSHWPGGCPCKIDIDKIAHIINVKQIHYRLIKIGSLLDKMCNIFKEKIVDYDEIPIDNASKMDIKISDMVIRELLPDYDYGIE